MENKKAIKTLKVRVKDKHAKLLRAMARDVNTIWNYCNETSDRAARPFNGRPVWLSGFDLNYLTSGFTKCSGVTVCSATMQQVCREYATRRNQFKKLRLRWRVSNPKSSKYSLGWVPFKKGAAKFKDGQVKFAGYYFGLWDSYGLSKYELRSGSFNEDSRGRWYFNVAVEIETNPCHGTGSVGIDLGWKDAATTSGGEKLHGRWYRTEEANIAKAQRANKKHRVRALHAKVSNRRKDAIHKFTTSLVKNYGLIAVGNVSSTTMVKRNGKSTLDAGWGMMKTMLEYKSHKAGIVFEEIDEAYTTQTCSCCGTIPSSSPKGRTGLGIREWVCMNCGTVHDRDINAARNILALGHERLAVGIPTSSVGRVPKEEQA